MLMDRDPHYLEKIERETGWVIGAITFGPRATPESVDAEIRRGLKMLEDGEYKIIGVEE